MVLSVMNLGKGGSGKSTLTANMAPLLPTIVSGAKVLVINLDDNYNAQEILAIPYEEVLLGIDDYLFGAATREESTYHSKWYVDVMPVRDQAQMDSGVPSEMKMRELVDEARTNYDFIWLDATASAKAWTVAATLAMADAVFIPVVPDHIDTLAGAVKTLDRIRGVQTSRHGKPVIAGIIQNMVKANSSHGLEGIRDTLALGDMVQVFRWQIRDFSSIEVARSKGTPINWASGPQAAEAAAAMKEIMWHWLSEQTDRRGQRR